MNAEEIAFLIIMIAMIIGVYFTYRVIRECDEDGEDIWS